jgi:hypothetical protein
MPFLSVLLSFFLSFFLSFIHSFFFFLFFFSFFLSKCLFSVCTMIDNSTLCIIQYVEYVYLCTSTNRVDHVLKSELHSINFASYLWKLNCSLSWGMSVHNGLQISLSSHIILNLYHFLLPLGLCSISSDAPHHCS